MSVAKAAMGRFRDASIGRDILYREVLRQQREIERDNDCLDVKDDNIENEDESNPTLRPPKQRRIYTPPSKRVGLTKIRLEDCYRCDACSCIYTDKSDYIKHIRNFHQRYNTIIPRIRKKSPPRPSYQEIMEAKGFKVESESIPLPLKSAATIPENPLPISIGHFDPSKTRNRVTNNVQTPSVTNCDGLMPSSVTNQKRTVTTVEQCSDAASGQRSSVTNHQLGSDIVNQLRINLQQKTESSLHESVNTTSSDVNISQSIKMRWSKVSERLMEATGIKKEPVEDPESDEMSQLLSQVEVKIKTEPLDEPFTYWS